MVIDNFDVVGIGINPTKADSPLVIDPNTVRASPIATQRLKPIARNSPQIRERNGGAQMVEFTLGRQSHTLQPSAELTPEDSAAPPQRACILRQVFRKHRHRRSSLLPLQYEL